MKKKQIAVKLAAHYPSACLLQGACFEDYKRVLETYNKIYDKINIALVFSGVVLVVILQAFDYTLFFKWGPNSSRMEILFIFVQLLCMITSSVSIVWAVVQLLLLTRSQRLPVFDSIAIRNIKIYNESPETAALWLIDKYTTAVSEMVKISQSKQKVFDTAVVKIVISISVYAFLIILQKGN